MKQKGFPLCDRNRSNSTMNTLTHSVASRVPSRTTQYGFSLVIYLALAVAILGLLTMMGHKVYSTIEESVWSEVRKEKEEATRVRAFKGHAASSSLEKGNAKARIVYRTIIREVDRIIDRPVYRDVCLDPDGLRLANDALTGQTTPTGQPDKPLPKPGTALRWDRSLSVEKIDRG